MQHDQVHDGQQRLVSLCLFMAAMRDNLLLWGDDFAEDAKDVSVSIFPVKARRKSVDRIKLREKNNELLSHILNKLDTEGSNSPELILPNLKSRKNMVESEKLILEAYEHFLQRIRELGPDKAIELLTNALEKVYLLVCIPANIRIARSMVMGLGRGKTWNLSTNLREWCASPVSRTRTSKMLFWKSGTDFVKKWDERFWKMLVLCLPRRICKEDSKEMVKWISWKIS